MIIELYLVFCKKGKYVNQHEFITLKHNNKRIFKAFKCKTVDFIS